MPNYKLSGYVTSEIMSRAAVIMENRLQHAQGGFPLTMEEIQTIRCSPDQLERMEWLKADGVKNLPRSSYCNIAVTKEVANIKRNVVLRLDTPEPFFSSVIENSVYGNTFKRKDISHGMFLKLDALSDTTVVALSTWIEGVVRERRLQQMVHHIVGTMFADRGPQQPMLLPTSGHLLIRWPLLATLVTDKDWKQRLRCPPVRTKQYAWPTGQPTPRVAGMMKAAETVLLAGDMLGSYKPDILAVRASVMQWERFETDKLQ